MHPPPLLHLLQLPGVPDDGTKWLIIGGAVLLITYTIIRPMAKKRKDPLDRPVGQGHLAKQRAVEREMGNLLVELSEMARQITAQLDTRATKLEPFTDGVLAQVQVDLFTLGAELACVPGKESKMSMKLLEAADAERLEKAIDAAEEGLPPLKSFILPGGSPQASALHLARTVCRRAERGVLALDDSPARNEIVIYLNRLSDLLFVLARKANVAAGVEDVPWAPRGARAIPRSSRNRMSRATVRPMMLAMTPPLVRRPKLPSP